MKTQKDPVLANIECSDIIEDEVKKYGEKDKILHTKNTGLQN
jgi:hypothetical protein